MSPTPLNGEIPRFDDWQINPFLSVFAYILQRQPWFRDLLKDYDSHMILLAIGWGSNRVPQHHSARELLNPAGPGLLYG